MSGPKTAGSDHVFARFFHDPTHGPVCEQTIGAEAGSPTVIERVTGAHIAAFPGAFAKFQESRTSVQPVGLPLKRGLGLPSDLAQLFVTHGVLDVETFAGLDDASIHRIMPGAPEHGIELRDRARLIFPDKAKWTKPVSLGGAERDPLDDISALKRKLAAAERERDEALAKATTPVGEPPAATDEPAAEPARDAGTRKGR